ncbi:MAG: deoxyguanosinetriphosphate triphosphohydrolase [Chloroflexi bacterium]|nr:deoxyguanosinetriphosphate triphosphohydrolase [Chloroflexota bacterium]
MDSRVRLRLEEREETLSPFAARSRLSRGRARQEEQSPVRTDFQRDRDRIIHSKAFRRLKHKTQVFIAPSGDHYVTRLTHTLEVSQIARTIARALNLNEDLTEAISLGHDLGHTPFGHAGEEVLDELLPQGFRHNEQSLRVVDVLEKEGLGLNLTWEVREGILKHSKSRTGILDEGWELPATLEGQICKLADTIAYINHDIADAIRAGVITEEDLPPRATPLLGHTPAQRIDTLVCDVIATSWAATGDGGGGEGPIIAMSLPVLEAANTLKDFLFQHVYFSSAASREAVQARRVVRDLYHYFIEEEGRLPQEHVVTGDSLERRVVDYVAGMTDQFALNLWQGMGFS